MQRVKQRVLVLATSATLLVGCGYQAGSRTIEHPAAAGEPALVQVSGYAYSDPTSVDHENGIAEAEDMAATMNDSAGVTAITSSSVHMVTASQTPRASRQGWMLLYEFQIDSRYADRVSSGEQAINGLAGADIDVEEERMSGVSVGVVTAFDGEHHGLLMGWYRDGVLYWAMGEDSSESLRDFVTKLLGRATR